MEEFWKIFCDLFSSETFWYIVAFTLSYPFIRFFIQLLMKGFKAETKASDSRRSDCYFNTLSDSDN